MKLDNTISAVVTGGASGLGGATARMLAAHGVKVAIFDVNEELGEAVAHEIGGVFCKANVTSTPRSTQPSPRRAPRTARSASSSIAPAPATRQDRLARQDRPARSRNFRSKISTGSSRST